MKYITRRILVNNLDRSEKQYVDTEFFSLKGPLVILGEPGSGKSEVVKQLMNSPKTIFYRASSVSAFPSLIIGSEVERVVIDGLDEITAYGAGTPIVQVLQRITNENIDNFIFTCRAVDWQQIANTSIILDRWQTTPVIGKILPLNDQEIIDFVTSNGDGQDGNSFFDAAMERSAADLLRNPQTLLMLIKVVSKSGWPKTRTELYYKACEILIQETNSFHKSLNRTRPSGELLLSVAGFICAQLILSNKSVINLDGVEDSLSIGIADCLSDTFEQDSFREALSTMIFKAVGNNSVEPSHRTIGEFLAAKWLSTELKKQISLRRVESILYGDNFVVPPALRGLHSWIATLGSPEIQDAFIKRDPYGVFRYGDPAEFSIAQGKTLLDSLKQLSKIDPYFRSEDWHATFGKGFAKPELKDDILSVLKNSKTPYQLSHLILESIKGEPFSKLIVSDLIEIVLNDNATYLERDAALEALKECDIDPNWINVIERLCSVTNMDASRLAIGIIEYKTEIFNSKLISEVLFTICKMNGQRSLVSGLGYSLNTKMNLSQLRETLEGLCNCRDKEDDPDEDEPLNQYPRIWISSFIYSLFKLNSPPSPDLTWRVLYRLRRYATYHQRDFSETINSYFQTNDSFRQKVQQIVLQDYEVKDFQGKLYRLYETSKGLRLRAIDLIARLDELLKEKDKFHDWLQRWEQLALHIIHNRDSMNDAWDHAKKQASNSTELTTIWNGLQKPKKNEYEEHEKKEKLKWDRKQKKVYKSRYESYERIKDQLISGKHIHGISEIAKAYLGWFNNIAGESPRSRVENLVGEGLTDIAINSISTAITCNEIPSARQIIDKGVKESKEYFLAPTLVAHYSLHSDKIGVENIDSVTSALAVCRWGIHYTTEKLMSELQNKLESIVFEERSRKHQFILDTIEPYFEDPSQPEHIGGLSRIASEPIFSDVAGDISFEWLRKFSRFSIYTLKELVKTCLKYVPPVKFLQLVNDKLQKEDWDNLEKRGVWFGALFILDFENSLDILKEFANEDMQRFWSFKNAVKNLKPGIILSANQNFFIISNFAAGLTTDATPPSGFVGAEHPWEASQFISERIKSLASDISNESVLLLKDLNQRENLNGYLNEVKHAYMQNQTLRAESILKNVSLNGVRMILLNQSPITHLDLQNLLLDQLDLLQRRLKHSPTKDYITFWNIDTPHNENYCRDRIVENLNPYLDRFNIRSHIEAAMPDNKRCDFLNTIGLIDLPIEIKGQWHPRIWDSAVDQLERYTREYRAEGFGIYLVLWFGEIPNKQPQKLNGKSPSSFEEMKTTMAENYQHRISTKTKLYVLDLSKPDS